MCLVYYIQNLYPSPLRSSLHDNNLHVRHLRNQTRFGRRSHSKVACSPASRIEAPLRVIFGIFLIVMPPAAPSSKVSSVLDNS